MTQLDLAVVLVAGVVGVAWKDPRVAWGVLGVWALLRMLKVL